ncbi:MAG: acylphosphatase, partial [Hyphomicrobiaceae bacterium]
GQRTVRLRIEGLVQGVGFRVFVEREAQSRGLTGWVRNRRDGGVEAVVSGPGGDVDWLIERVHEGPRFARVDMVKVLDETEHPASRFEVRATA